jgi:hypothetical protein
VKNFLVQQAFKTALVLMLAGVSSATATPADCSNSLKALGGGMAGPQANFACLHISKKTFVAAWTTRNNMDYSSHISLVVSGTAVQKIDLNGGFDTRLILGADAPLRDRHIFFAITSYGAGAEDANVFAMRGDKLQEVFHAEGDRVDILHLSTETTQLAIHHSISSLDVPDLFEFIGGKFVNCNLRYPTYYNDIIRTQGLSSRSVVAPSLKSWFDKLLKLSGEM